MKFFARLILFVFVTFLSTPTVVTLIKKSSDTSIFYSFAEEEIHKQIKEVKAEVKQQFDYPFLDLQIKNTTIISENLSRHDNVASEIFSPPPEFS
ncbi:hypothetical protein [Flavobacterium sangjuense]|uniref:Uncharacterized protein n=1 Tax=Flavobacterium sangjuense TaxID=2518177 RepID=A0A4P7PTD1_9FLAO|nr:hypothetical protein [Flavobacterium sangjuense]QBZ98208.1 hypothetical protein GS03_01713 [Flavobacterium sangjuense]